jgi:hypothetical protein
MDGSAWHGPECPSPQENTRGSGLQRPPAGAASSAGSGHSYSLRASFLFCSSHSFCAASV